MCFGMLVEMVSLSESLVTNITIKWPLSAVGSCVCFKSVCPTTGVCAYLAPVGLLPTVYPHMFLQGTWLY